MHCIVIVPMFFVISVGSVRAEHRETSRPGLPVLLRQGFYLRPAGYGGTALHLRPATAAQVAGLASLRQGGFRRLTHNQDFFVRLRDAWSNQGKIEVKNASRRALLDRARRGCSGVRQIFPAAISVMPSATCAAVKMFRGRVFSLFGMAANCFPAAPETATVNRI